MQKGQSNIPVHCTLVKQSIVYSLSIFQLSSRLYQCGGLPAWSPIDSIVIEVKALTSNLTVPLIMLDLGVDLLTVEHWPTAVVAVTIMKVHC